MIAIESHDEGVILPVRAQPGSRKSELRGGQDSALKIAVTQIAEKRKANKALVACLSKQLGLRKSQIEMISGETSPQKKFLVRDVTIEQLCAAIDAILVADR